MTSHFDWLMSLWLKVDEKPEEWSKRDYLRPEVEALADMCIAEANKRKKGWNFPAWKEAQGSLYRDRSEFEKKMRFLNDCHDTLDHNGGWHLRVFSPEVAQLIQLYYQIIVERKTEIYDVNRLKKKFPDLGSIVASLGYHPTDKRGWLWLRDDVR